MSKMIDERTVAVFGCGISGLSCAHDLAEKGYNVHIYEKFLEPGGVARSYRETPESPPSEYSWRGYGPFYHNVFDLMKKIPIGEKKSVYDNLSRPMQFLFTTSTTFRSFNHEGSKRSEGGIKLLEGLSWHDRLVLGISILKVMTAGKKRTEYYASISASEYMKSRMSEKGWKIFISMFGPWVGIDPQRASLYHVIFFIGIHWTAQPEHPYKHKDEEGEWELNSFSGWSVFNKPTSEAWFDPWVKHLKNIDVTFKFGYKLNTIHVSNDKIEYVTVVDTENNHEYIVKNDYYVLAISPFAMVDVLKRSVEEKPNKNLSNMLDQFTNLVQDGPHNQVSFRIGFDKAVEWIGKRNPLILSDSEFNITIYRQDEFWKTDVYLGPDIKSLWSGTACVSYDPGEIYQRPVNNLTKDEFRNEIFNQLSKDQGFNILLKEGCGMIFSELIPNIIYFEVWRTWEFNQPLTTSEPKYVDSIHTRPYQPNAVTPFHNMWLAGGHVKNSTDIWSMEAAAEAGRQAAGMIAETHSTLVKDRGMILNFLGYIDDIFYTGGDSISIVGVIVAVLIFLIVYIILLKKLM